MSREELIRPNPQEFCHAFGRPVEQGWMNQFCEISAQIPGLGKAFLPREKTGIPYYWIPKLEINAVEEEIEKESEILHDMLLDLVHDEEDPDLTETVFEPVVLRIAKINILHPKGSLPHVKVEFRDRADHYYSEGRQIIGEMNTLRYHNNLELRKPANKKKSQSHRLVMGDLVVESDETNNIDLTPLSEQFQYVRLGAIGIVKAWRGTNN